MDKRSFLKTAVLASAAVPVLGRVAPAMADVSARNKEIVALVGDAVFNAHDFSPIDRHMKADYIQHNPLVPQGRDGFREFFAMTFAAVPDWAYEPSMLSGEGDLVWAYGTYTGTQTGEWLGIPPSGKAFAIAAVDIFRLEDGQLAEHWDVMDIYGLFKQLGVIA